jgi:glycolate oxidase
MDECDVVVPASEIAGFLKFVNELEKKYGIRIRSFGHAGDGNLHIYVCRDKLEEKVWKEKLDIIMKEMYDKAIELKGQVSGEHGIGHAKIEYLKDSVGKVNMSLIESIKKAFDDKNILNPGKINAYNKCL